MGRNNHRIVKRTDGTFSRGIEVLASGRGAEGFGAFRAGADAAEMVVAINAGGMAIGKANLDCVVAYLRRSFGAGLGLEHG